jgi:hypothetical protein
VERLSGRVVAREIVEAEHPAVALFLARGFGYPAAFFTSLFEILRRHETPEGFPRYGYVLTNGDRIVGAILLIFTRMEDGDKAFVRCHVTSWCVEPEYRPLASVFFARALKRKDVAYINVSARSWTQPIIESQGFSRYSNGQFMTVAIVNALTGAGARGVVFRNGADAPDGECSAFERKLLADHAAHGCLTVWCVDDGVAWPFVFHALPTKRVIPAVQLVYCRSVESFVRFARPLGRYLLGHGKMVVRIDANGPVPGLIGKYFDDVDPRFCKGERPRLGDLAYTQLAICPFERMRIGLVSS